MSIALSGVQLIIQSDLFNHEYDFRPNWTKFCDQLHCNHNYNKICSVLSFFKVSTQDIPRVFASSEKKNIQVHACDYVTVQLLKYDSAVQFISAEIRTADSQ